jgi:hypothetical protein
MRGPQPTDRTTETSVASKNAAIRTLTTRHRQLALFEGG